MNSRLIDQSAGLPAPSLEVTWLAVRAENHSTRSDRGREWSGGVMVLRSAADMFSVCDGLMVQWCGRITRNHGALRLVANLDARPNPTIAVPGPFSPSPVAGRRDIDWLRRNIDWGVVIARCHRRSNNGTRSETAKHTSGDPSAVGSSLGWHNRRADDDRAHRQYRRSNHVRLRRRLAGQRMHVGV